MAVDQTLRTHLRATLVLGVPLVLAQLAQISIGMTDSIMLGWLGTTELAAGTLAFQLFFIFLIVGIGFGAAMVPLIANALGREDPRSVRRAGRMGLWVLLGVSILFMVPLWFTRQILILFGQEAELAQMAQNYMRIAQWSMIPAFILIGMRSFLTSIEKANAVLWITVFTATLNGLLNYAFIFGNWGAPRLEMEGAGVATLIANTVAAGMALMLVAQTPAAKPYTLFVRFWRPDWQAIKEIFRLGIPISLSIFAEAGMFSAASVMIGWIGEIPLAAHGIALQWAAAAFMIPLGLAQAASVRVGNAAGRNDNVAIGLAGRAVVILGLAFAVLTALVFLTMPEQLVRVFLDAKSADLELVISYAVPMLYMAAAFQIFDTLQVASGSNLRGLQDTKVPMFIATFSYWIVGMGSAYLFAFPMGYGGVGVWGGLVVGLAAAGAALTYRFANRARFGLVPAVTADSQ
ncbi:MAG: MATE family efflux transporter [Rhizobiaceae bacterium]